MTIRQALRVLLLACCLLAGTVWAQATAPVIISVTAQFDGQSETKRVTLPAEASTTGQHVALLERTHTYDVGGSMPRVQWEERFAAGLPDDTIPLGCDTTTCQFMRHRSAKTGVDVTLRPMTASGAFQQLSIGVTLHRFQPSPDAEAPRPGRHLGTQHGHLVARGRHPDHRSGWPRRAHDRAPRRALIEMGFLSHFQMHRHDVFCGERVAQALVSLA